MSLAKAGKMKERILYVDDEPENLKALQRLFRNEQFHFITFESPITALRKIDEIRPAVVISDQRMPDMEGTLFLEKIRKKRPDTVRIILTGHADLDVAILAINQGNVFRFIKKPWDNAAMKAEIISALDYYELISGLHASGEKGLEEIIKKKERLTGVKELAGAVCHELGQPLAIISGYSQLLKQEYLGEDSLICNYLSNVIIQIEKMNDITTKIKSIARYETCKCFGKQKIIDIDKSVN